MFYILRSARRFSIAAVFAVCSSGEVASKVSPTDAFYSFPSELHTHRDVHSANAVSALSLLFPKRMTHDVHTANSFKARQLALVAIYTYRLLQLVFNALLTDVLSYRKLCMDSARG